MDVYIVEDPKRGVSRLDQLPNCRAAHLYIKVGQRDMWTLCQDIGLEKAQLPKLNAIVFLHGSNPEATDTSAIESAVGWPKDAELIAYVALRTCMAGGRVVIFSGGEPDCNFEALDRTLANAQYEMKLRRGHHYDFIPLDEIVRDHPIFRQELIPPKWPVRSLRRQTDEGTLFASLSILCQGYLASFVDPDTGNPDLGDDDPHYESVRLALQRMFPRGPSEELYDLRNLLRLELLRRDSRKEIQKEVSNREWWNIFSNVDAESCLKEKRGSKAGLGIHDVAALLREIDEGPSVRPGIVANAFLALTEHLASHSP